MDKTKPDAAGRKSFTKAFKQEAVARLKKTDNATALALELGVRRNLLYKWAEALEKAGAEKAFNGPGRPLAQDEDELTRLRRENERLKMENAILKKADAYFAKRKP
ncbi:transposase [Telluria sp. Tellsp104]|jgi:transposase